MIGNITKIMMAAYDEAALTISTLFLSGFFGKNPQELYISKNEKVAVDVKRDEEQIAIDVVRGGDGTTNVNPRFSTKEYSPPLYDEYLPISAADLNKRQLGNHPFVENNPEANFTFLAVQGMMKMTKKILRAIEKQAAQTLFDGIVTLKNTESLDFKRKSTHNITPVNKWDDTTNANPIADLKVAAEFNRIDGKMTSNIVIMGSEAWDSFIVHPRVTAYLDNRRIEAGLIQPSFKSDGVTFQGVMWIGDYRFELYTYPQFYTDDEGSTHTPYTPTKQVCVMNGQARLDKAFAAVEVLPIYQEMFSGLGLGSIPEMQMGQFIPYAYNKPPKTANVGIQSAPLIIPTSIDTFANINALA